MSQINLDTLKNLKENMMDDLEIVHEIIDTYLSTSPDRVAQILSFVKSGDILGASKEGHSLKSSSKAMGADHLSVLCKQMEDLKNNLGDIEKAKELSLAIAAEYQLVEVDLKSAKSMI